MLKYVYRLQINFALVVSVSGILVGAIDISAANGELLFPFAQLDHEGNYNLTVFTSNGNDTATYKLIVYCKFRRFFNKFSYTCKKKGLHWLYCKLIINWWLYEIHIHNKSYSISSPQSMFVSGK